MKDHRFLWLPALAMSRPSAEGFAEAGSSRPATRVLTRLGGVLDLGDKNFAIVTPD